MRIKTKLIISSLLIFILFSVMIATLLFGYLSIQKVNLNARNIEKEMLYLQGVLRGFAEYILDEGEPLSKELINKNITALEETHEKLMVMLEKNELNLQKSDYADNLNFNDHLQNLKSNRSFLLNADSKNTQDEEFMLTYGAATANADEFIEHVQVTSDIANEMLEATVKKIGFIVSIVATIILIGIICIIIGVYRLVILPINKLRALMSNVLDHEGDLTSRINIKGNDEIADTAHIFNKILDKLQTVIMNIANVTHSLAANSAQLSSSTTEIDAGTLDASKQISDISNSTSEISNSITLVAENSSDLSSAVKESSDVAIEGKAIVDETVSEIGFIAQTVEISAFTVNKLGNSSKKINDIVQVIDDISAQTNLLALNAAIEAARAGEAGRGFGVVADEVRKLAERTSLATGEITKTIKQINEDTDLSVKNMDQGRSKVEHGIELAEKAKASLERIVNVSQRNFGMVEGIDSSSVIQAQALGKISNNMEQMTNIARSTQESMSQINSSTNALAELAYELNSIIGWFNVSDSTEDITVNDADNMPFNTKVEHSISK